MQRSIISLLLLAAVLVVFVGGCSHFFKPEPIGDSPPVIDDFFASPNIQWGHSWRVYIKAHDPDGDMWSIDFQIDQPGKLYPPGAGLVNLPKSMWAEIDGYFYWDILGSPFNVGSQNIKCYVQLIDRGDRRSQKIELPLRIGITPATPPPDQFKGKPALFRIPMNMTVEHAIPAPAFN